ncbi:hypothetical protein RCL_jg15343.t1 [Rhizophagus clarus]|uniref:Uncharacterized protein n=1 Tax=Rhizophagus clarus TaxID=94130 RepID=A0A8H3KRU5_9GLOM|nr:hypothetical protein RCL_jg15343.t1 [Rhizophagus clarus]
MEFTYIKGKLYHIHKSNEIRLAIKNIKTIMLYIVDYCVEEIGSNSVISRKFAILLIIPFNICCGFNVSFTKKNLISNNPDSYGKYGILDCSIDIITWIAKGQVCKICSSRTTNTASTTSKLFHNNRPKDFLLVNSQGAMWYKAALKLFITHQVG